MQAEPAPDAPVSPTWSRLTPGLQLAWDATSLRSFMSCPRRYWYEIVQGYRSRGKSVDLVFGGLYASALEAGWKARASGASRDDAQRVSLRWVLEHSGEYEAEWTHTGCNNVKGVWVPWGGTYETQWRCTGTEKYKNGRGNAAKCPMSHVGHWMPDHGPASCSKCGSPTQTARRWLPYDTAKDRLTLVRLVVWYWEEQDPDACRCYVFPDGRPAVELSFAFPLGVHTAANEAFLLCGHIDRVDELLSEPAEHFFVDNKTTKHALGRAYFAQYSPDIQMDTYDFATSMILPGLNVSGGMIEAAQTQVGGAAYGHGMLDRWEEYREEFLHELETYWLPMAERYATENYWPMNRASCYLCGFKSICAARDREQALAEAGFEKNPWDPMRTR